MTDEEKRREQDRAEKAHDDQHALALDHMKSAWVFAGEFYKLTGTVGVGSLAATVAILASKPDKIVRDALLAAAPWLSLGLLAVVVSSGLAYFAQYSFARSHEAKKRRYYPEFIADTPESRKLFVVGAAFQWSGVVCAVSSVVLLGVGFWRLVAALRSFSAVQ